MNLSGTVRAGNFFQPNNYQQGLRKILSHEGYLFIYLFMVYLTAVNNSDYIAPDDRMAMNNEFELMTTVEVVA
jgi:hypothetical protein